MCLCCIYGDVVLTWILLSLVASHHFASRRWTKISVFFHALRAQRHFCRATRLDPQCAEAWIAFGTSFAACDESDQALASFRAAQRLAPGNHISLLYIGTDSIMYSSEYILFFARLLTCGCRHNCVLALSLLSM
jgi:hypothetical protein